MGNEVFYRWWTSAVEGERGIVFAFFRLFLTFLSLLYLVVLRLLRGYKKRFIPRKSLNFPVISVGNITLGGTGKTPVVIYLSQKLLREGIKPAVVATGYGGSNKEGVVSDGKKLFMDWRETGDEAFLLARELKDIPVLIGRDRLRQARYARENFHIDTVILDDGFQYWPLEREGEIVVIDGTNPFGNGFLFPRGILREPRGELGRANLIWLTRVDQAQDLQGLKRILKDVAPGVPLVESIHCPIHIENRKGTEVYNLNFIRHRRVIVFSGIGNPFSFEATLRSMNPEIVEVIRYPDHHLYTLKDVEDLNRKIEEKKAELVITTDKDGVKFPPEVSLRVPLLLLKVKIQVVKGEEALQNLLKKWFPKGGEGSTSV